MPSSERIWANGNLLKALPRVDVLDVEEAGRTRRLSMLHLDANCETAVPPVGWQLAERHEAQLAPVLCDLGEAVQVGPIACQRFSKAASKRC